MVSEKSKSNLKRGNPGKRKKSAGNQNAAGGASNTWAELIRAHGDTACELAPGKTWKQATVEAAYRQAILGNAAILRELMARSEPQDIGIAHSGKLTIEIIEDGAITFTTPTHSTSAN
jgi:hypothetical protein